MKPGQEKQADNIEVGNYVVNESYMNNLQYQYDRQVFLLKDIKEVNNNYGNKGNA